MDRGSIPSLLCGFTLCALALTGCPKAMPQNDSGSSKPDINAVLTAHQKEILSVPGVVGLYVGVMDDKKTPCIKVMLSRLTPENTRAIPDDLEGYRVIKEVTGEIRPLKNR
jgi:hypothetical protein